MNRKLWFCAVVLGSLSCPALAVEEPFCAPPDDCSPDVLSLRFVNGTSDFADAKVGDVIEARVFMDINTPKVTGTTNCPQPPPPPPEGPDCDYTDPQPPITECSTLQGFSYGVKHDTALMDIQLASRPPAGAADAVRNADFNITGIAENLLGMISGVAITIDACPPFDLPPEAKNLQCAVIRYKVKADIKSPAGTKLQFTGELNPPKSPATPVSLTYSGKSKRPKTVNNAIIKGPVGPTECPEKAHAFYFGPAATATEFDIANANSVKVSMRNRNTSLGFSLGIRKNAAALTFVGNLGLPEPRELAIVTMTNDNPPVLVEVAGDQTIGNSARGAPTTDISTVVRGAAIAGFSTDDFFGVDPIRPGEDPDGVGATVGYVSDRLDPLDKVIPAVTDPAGACGPNNEILTVNFGPVLVNFSRGDANGDRKLNVTDGVIIAQNIFLNRFVFFACQDMLDANDDGVLNTNDPVYLLSYLFLRGTVLAPPFKVCAPDGTAGDALGCAAPNCTA